MSASVLSSADTSTAVRLGWALSPAGRFAACKVADASGALILERREPFSSAPRSRFEVEGITPEAEVFVSDTGTVTVVTAQSGSKAVHVIDAGGRLTTWRHQIDATARVRRGPGDSVDSYRTVGGTTVITRYRADSANQLACIPWRVMAGHRLAGTELLLNVIGDSGFSKAVKLDLRMGRMSEFFSVSDRCDDRVVAVSGNTVVVSTKATGESRLGWGALEENRIRFPQAGKSDRAIGLLAIQADGSRAVLVEDRGLSMPWRLVDLRTDQWKPLDEPRAVPGGPGSIDAGRLRVPVADMAHPGTVVEIGLDQTPRVVYDDAAVQGLPATQMIEIAGPGGAIETLVVGEPATARRIVVALHGGPFAAWRATHNVLFNDLAAQGVAVLAPNVRGSIGYGRAHTNAIHTCWGDVDLQDVLAVGRWVSQLRPTDATPPVLLGESYGAYLALLATATAPYGTWSACAAISGFTSGARIAGLGGPTAELARRFGGIGSPDLLELAPRFRVPVLLMHGALDDVVPVEESVTLGAALAAGGCRVDVVTDPFGGHDLMSALAGRTHRAHLIDFVLGTPRRTQTTPTQHEGRG